MNRLEVEKHIKYFQRCLGILPSSYENQESNKLAIIYFSLCGLDLLSTAQTGITNFFKPSPNSKLKTSIELINNFIEYIYTNSIETDQFYGFRGSHIYENAGEFDFINLSSTCFALQILLILGDDLLRIKRTKLMNYVINCQKSDGSFGSYIYNGVVSEEDDGRYCMFASTIRKILKWDEECWPNNDKDIDLVKLREYIISLKAFDGGLGISRGCESHAGLTFCGLNSLKLVNILKKSGGDDEWDDTVSFLVHRQIGYSEYNSIELEENEESDVDDQGGFNGRLNKLGDTCYAFWCAGSLKLFEMDKMVDANGIKRYLLNGTQHRMFGGFCKTNDPDELPDPLHSFLGLATLSLLGFEGVGKLNIEFVLSERVVSNWKKIEFK